MTAALALPAASSAGSVGLTPAFLTLLDRLRLGSTLPLEADVPFWYGEYEIGGRNFADEVLRRVNAVTVMSYRDTGTGPKDAATRTAPAFAGIAVHRYGTRRALPN
ncbi:hypothetical protein [Couchioplanes caeruleus]|uniref:Uncharacterized protein n=1 Tax=Couchioplanes caeruleus subsp. caeruleus TaxID=56427 RepID=A0A1K0FS61_9ACTN|nr:hypothetical protein [Couchioplanes caeruleus]OJF15536.1 hypothetical protein BG844_04140 [Couchioplanes caeruleus subsp. caeruleus]